MIHDADSVSDKDNLEKKMLTNVNLILLLFKDQFVIGRLAKKSRNNKKRLNQENPDVKRKGTIMDRWHFHCLCDP